jgi:tetratricopeptide (TPR) repeat protein
MKRAHHSAAFALLASLPLLARPAAAQDAPAPPQDAPGSIQALIAAGDAAQLRADYDTARQALAQAWDLAQQSAPEDPLRYDVLKRLVSVRSAAGEFADADNYLLMAINWRETVLGPDDPKINDDLLLSVALCRGLKQFDRASAVLARVLAAHVRTLGFDNAAVADDFTRMALISMDRANPADPAPELQNAATSLNSALDIRTRLSGPLHVSLVPDLDRLGGVYTTLRDYPKAEATYRHALVIRESVYGKENADLIATVDGLAYSLFGQKKYDEAEPVYQRLVALWAKSVGPEHPMMAVAMEKLAVFYAEQKKYVQAREAADRGIAIRAHFLALGLSGEATELLAEGNNPEARTYFDRALKALDPPDPFNDKLRDEIGVMKKSLQIARK